MITWKIRDLETGQTSDALGETPKGILTYSADGRMMVLVLHPKRTRPKELLPTQVEKIELYDTMFAYAGTYTIENSRVVHQIDMSWNAVWEGTEQVRSVDIDGLKLTYESEPAKNPLSGAECIHTVVFQKIV